MTPGTVTPTGDTMAPDSTAREHALAQFVRTGIPQVILTHGGPFAYRFAVVPATSKLLPQLCGAAKAVALVCGDDNG